MKNIKNNKPLKYSLIGGLFLALLIVGFFIGKSLKPEDIPTISQEDIANLIETDYEVEKVENTENKGYIAIKGDLEREEVKELAIAVNDKINIQNEGVNQVEVIEVEIYATSAPSIEENKDKEGLTDTIVIESEKKQATIENELDVANVEKMPMSPYDEGIVEVDGNTAYINFNMNFKVMEEATVAGELLSFIDLFKSLNEDIKEVDLKVNINKDKGFKYNSLKTNKLIVTEKVYL